MQSCTFLIRYKDTKKMDDYLKVIEDDNVIRIEFVNPDIAQDHILKNTPAFFQRADEFQLMQQEKRMIVVQYLKSPLLSLSEHVAELIRSLKLLPQDAYLELVEENRFFPAPTIILK